MFITINCRGVELDNGETLADRGVGNCLELIETVASMTHGTLVLMAYQGTCRDRARLHKMPREDLQAARPAAPASR